MRLPAENTSDRTDQELARPRGQLAFAPDLLEIIPDAVVVVNAAGAIVNVNTSAERMFNYPRRDLLYQPIEILIPAPLAAAHRGHRELFLAHPRQRSMGQALDLRAVRRDGTTFAVEVQLTPIAGDDGPYVVCLVRDLSEKERAAVALQASEHRFLMLADQASDGIFMSDLGGRYVAVNDAACSMLGYSREELLRMEIADIIAPVDRARLPEEISRLATGAPVKSEWTFVRHDGTIFTGEVNARILADERLLAVLRDVTSRTQALEALRQSEERFRTLIEDLDVGVLVMDARDDRVLLSNRSAQDMLGLTVEELGGMAARDWPRRLVTESGQNFVRADLPSSIAAREDRAASAIIGSYTATNDTIQWFQVTARPRSHGIHGPKQVLVTLSDITARKQAEQALITAQAEWEHSFDALTDWVSVLDRDGRVLRANRAMRERFEPALGSLVGRSYRAIYQCESASGIDPCEGVLSGGPPVEFTTLLQGVEGHFVISCSPLRDGGGAVHVVRDITRQQKLEEQLLQSQKMHALGQLAGGVAHDFNNLLTVIISCAELADLDLHRNPDAVPESIVAILDAARRASALTRQLLLFGRKGVWEEKLVNVNDVVQRSDAMLRRLISEDVELVTIRSPSLWSTRADPAQLEQVVLNLALNARDAMPLGGRLSIETRNQTFDAAACQADPARRPGAFVELTVRDTGIGVSAEVRSHLFEPFFTTKGLGRGTGLGLSTVYGIVDHAGGFITVESEPEHGAAFHVYLPAAMTARSALAAPEPSAPQAVGHETVLLVEDERAVRRAMVRSLRSSGFQVIDVASASDAMHVLRGESHDIKILVTDVVMPGESGPELAVRARELHPNLPVLFISGYNPDATIARGDVSGGPLLQKPFSLGDLARKIREVLDAASPE
ncbi:MAG: PAS domain S-box protein [Gemmatimonadaceae bacterium]